VVLEVEEDERLVRDGDDLIFELPLSFSQAALGRRSRCRRCSARRRFAFPPGCRAAR
jgi:DnaJ-class molecular chaperone